MNNKTFQKTALSTLLMLAFVNASAGDFTNVPYTTPDATVVNGANNPNADPLYISSDFVTWVSGFENLVAQTINYTATGGSYTLTLLAYNKNDDFTLAGEELGDLYDMVYRDSRDNKLVFGTRVILDDEADDAELNFITRAGFTGYETSVAWTFSGDNDLRMYNAARTASEELDGPFAADADVVRMQTDVSTEESNPFSGLYLIKTNAENYVFTNNAIGYIQAGEEGQGEFDGSLNGYAAVAAIPETDTYAMLLAGLGIMGLVARRRRI